MDIKTIVLFISLAAVTAVPIDLDPKNKTNIEVLIRKGVVGFVPIVIRLDEDFSLKNSDDGSIHKIKRRAFREELIRDVLEDFESQKNGELSGLKGRIKTLPSWVG
ncbi:unnamed protein product [Danaus chrysippus]|uniref:(African queen) hypothetical protein n=1 Tax=Danaus chrysippus TaxID=151541 RepID=A0A8J2QJE5_9NEOP|nr:unnamed protein product [Danaus chrysippus]